MCHLCFFYLQLLLYNGVMNRRRWDYCRREPPFLAALKGCGVGFYLNRTKRQPPPKQIRKLLPNTKCDGLVANSRTACTSGLIGVLFHPVALSCLGHGGINPATKITGVLTWTTVGYMLSALRPASQGQGMLW